MQKKRKIINSIIIDSDYSMEVDRILENYSNFAVKQKHQLINNRPNDNNTVLFPYTQFPFVVFLLATTNSIAITAIDRENQLQEDAILEGGRRDET